tara:strand:+ start:7209 stop:8234 length:1026 start_codon:yes stop_codon:yes gene_type:complete
MKVLYITPQGVGGTSPQIEMAQHLRPRFERLDLCIIGLDNLSAYRKDWDVVFGAMETACPVALQVSSQMNIPAYGHWEYIPPFRIHGYPGGSDPLLWGYREEHLAEHYQNKRFYSLYKSIIDAAAQSTISSCAGHAFKETAKTFSGHDLDNCFIKYPASPMPLNKDRNAEKRDYFITVSRLVPNKRVADLAKAVRKANLETTWVIVGDGPEKAEINRIMKDSKTKVHYMPNTNGEKKFFFLSRAKFQLSAWHGLPQLEAALVGTPTINLDIDYIRELYGDSLTWAATTEDLVHEMRNFAENPVMCKQKADTLYEAAIGDALNINTIDQAADIIEDTLRKIL